MKTQAAHSPTTMNGRQMNEAYGPNQINHYVCVARIDWRPESEQTLTAATTSRGRRLIDFDLFPVIGL
jgi:hypothetical protein